MEFAHCVRCGHWPQLYPESKKRYFLTSCLHLFCETCSRASPQQCSVCQRSCQYKEVGGQAGKDLKDLFADPSGLIKSAIQQIPKALQVLEFQKHLQKDTVRVVGKLMETCKAMKREIECLKTSLGQKDTLIKELQTQLANRQSVNNPSSGADPFGLFRDSLERPNAHVQPIIQSQFSSAAGGNESPNSTFVRPATPPSSIVSLGSSIGLGTQTMQLFRYPPTATPHSITSVSSIPVRRSSFPHPFSSELPQRSFSQLGDNSRTPQLIQRLRSMRCRTTPISDGNHQPPRF